MVFQIYALYPPVELYDRPANVLLLGFWALRR